MNVPFNSHRTSGWQTHMMCSLAFSLTWLLSPWQLHAQTDCNGGDNPQGPAVPAEMGDDCNVDDPSQFESKCWYSFNGIVFPDWPPSGFPLAMNLYQGFGPGDYPPLNLVPFPGRFYDFCLAYRFR
jgi:hypothetical protein